MARVQKTSAEVRKAIQRKSAYSLPNNPTDSGFKANDIRNALYKPVIDATNSALSEIDRIVDELNGLLECVTREFDAIMNVAGMSYHGSYGLIYSFHDGEFTVTGNDEVNGEIFIPSTVFYQENYYPVVAVGEGAFKGSDITRAVIASGVLTIGENAFYTSHLQAVKLCGRTAVAPGAFYGSIAFSVPKEYLSAYKEELGDVGSSIEGFDTVNNNAMDIASLFKEKVTKVVGECETERAYVISATGAQITRRLVDTPSDGDIPVYSGGGRLSVKTPQSAGDATSKGYVESRLCDLGAKIDLSIDPDTYIMTLKLKNERGDVLSMGVVDLPLESMVIGAKYANGILSLNIRTADEEMENAVIDVEISDLISGLVKENELEAEAERLDGRIDDANYAHRSLVQEIEASKIYAHAAYHAEEAETSRSYTKGGKIDRNFKTLERSAASSISLTMDSDYKLTIALKNRSGEVLSEGMVDLPIESLITSASYENKVLTLKLQSGQTLDVSIADIISGLVPETRRVNGKALSADITLTASDAGAYEKSETYSRTEIAALIDIATTSMQKAIDEKQAVGFSYLSAKAEKAGGYTKGGEIDRELCAIKKRISDLESKTT